MALRPAYETDLSYGGHTVTLRASLRAAAALNDLPGGIPGAWHSLMRQSYSGIRQVLLATATDRAGAQCLLASLSRKPLAPFLPEAQAACLDLMAHLLPEPSNGPAEGKSMSWGEFIAASFKYATGYLEWSPAEAWAASPVEIDAAMIGHAERLGLMNGSDGTPEASGPVHSAAELELIAEGELDPEFDRHGLRELKAMFG